MNQSYRLVWNRVRNAWMVVGECARSMGKGGGTARRTARRQPRGSLAAMVNRVGAFGWAGVIGMVGLLGTPLAWSQAARVSSVSSLPPAQLAPPAVNALPQGAQVVAGQVQIQQAVNQLTVQQQSSKAIINWQSFDIGQQATVQFQQPGADAVALNRVQSGAASQIYGKLVANGQVFLLNANGVLFGPDAQVDVGALVAGAMKISDADFLAGRMNFTEGQGVVTNRGTLSAREAGFIALLAPEVRNEGIIRAQRGTVVLAAGEAITLRNTASGLTVVVDKGALQALIDNRHLVSAEDGTVFMTARAASALQQAVITNSGRIEAKGAVRVGGTVRLSADVVNNSGTVDASAATAAAGKDESQNRSKGGNIQIAASSFTNTGSIRANGDAGGRIEVLANKTLTNEGTIEARGIQGAGGQVVLTSGGQLLQTDTGRLVVTSEGAVQVGGRVLLRAAQLHVQGQMDARSEQGTGGRIDMAALQVSLQAAQLDVSGEQGGGQLQLQGLSSADPIAASLSSTALEAAASRPGLQEAPNAPVPVPDAPTGPSRTFISGSTLNAGSRRGQGGEVTLLGDEIELRGNTLVTATGETGGGHIFVGGGWQGGGGLPQATRALVDSTVTLDASAITQGDGGTIVVWSDVSKASGVTTVNGQLAARGGTLSGNGGRIETSGYDLRVDGIQVSTAAPKGQTGEWLLDPYDITISSGTGSGTTGTYTANANSAVINISALQTALNTSNVRVYTGDSGSQTGNITVAAALTNSTSNSLTLHAAGSIVINADLTSSGTGVLSLLAGSGSIGGTGSLILGSAGNLTGATLQIAHGATVSNNIVLNGATTVKLEGLLVDYLVVGGGGGGGGFYAGGGGGGGVLRGSLYLLGTGYSVTVGAGGAAGMNLVYGTNGGSSSAFGLTALGGGAGGYNNNSTKGGSGNGTAGKSGASGGGGGGSDSNNTGGSTSSFVGGSGGAATQGNSGGQGASGYNAGGGGGGAGSAGSAGSDTAAGNGGSGLASSITGVSITYGSGGGGGAPVGFSGGAGGPGAGDGAIGTYAGTPNGGDGSANTGGGGGGGAWKLGQDMYGGNGGSGTVVVRYASSTSVTSGGTAGSYTSGGVTYRFHRFTNVGAGTLNVGSGLTATLSGTISGTGALTTNAAGGTITLTGTNTYSGNTTISAGTLEIGGAGRLGSGNYAGTITNNGTLLKVNTTANQTLSGVISGTGDLTKDSSGTLTLSGTNTYSGDTSIEAGALKSGSATALGSGAVSVTSGAALDLGGQTMTSTGALTLNGTGISSGGALLNSSTTEATYAGLVTLASASSIVGDTGSITLSNTGTVTGSSLGLTLGGAAGGSIASIIGTGTGTLTKTGAGTWTLSGANTYSGANTISAGTLKAGSATALGSGTVSVTSGAALDLNGQMMTSTGALTLRGTGISSGGALLNSSATAARYAGLVTLGSASSIVGGAGSISLSNTGTITGSGLGLTLGGTAGGSIASIIGTGTGTLTKEGSGTWSLSGVSTFSGATTVSAGTLEIAGAGSLGSGSYAGAMANAGMLHINTTASQTLSGVISGAGGLTKSTTSTLTLSGANTYSGGTSLVGGTLTALHSTAMGTDTLTMSGSTTLMLGAGTTIANAITLSGAATIGLVPVVLNVEYLLVGGGGGGGWAGSYSAGGGGGGQVLQGSVQLSLVNPLAVVVGAGGAGASSKVAGGTGSSSTFNGFSAAGGGGGGSGQQDTTQALPTAGYNGGGGGGSYTNTFSTGATGASGNRGGAGVFHNTVAARQGGGGGAGAGGNGVNATDNGTTVVAGNGGAGVVSLISGSSMTYGGGGGGGSRFGTAGSGFGGGGAGGRGAAGTAGSANRGGGGGGGGGDLPSSYNGGAGGSGVVIVRYSSSTPIATGGTVTTGSGFQIHTFNASGTFALDPTQASGSASLTGLISGSNALTLTPNSGTLILTNNNTYTGTTTLNAGTVKVGTGGTTGSLGTGDISNSAALQYNRSDAWTVANVISGSGTLTKLGGGTLTLTAANTYSGDTTVTAGTLQIGSGAVTGTLGSGSVTNNATLAFNRSDAVTVGNAISGTGNVSVKGGNTFTLTANSTYIGTTDIDTGTVLVLQNDTPTTGSSAFNGPGSLVVESVGTSFSTALSTSAMRTGGLVLGSSLGGLQLGKSGNTAGVTLNNANSIAGGLTVYGGSVTVNQAFVSTGSGNILIEGSGLTFGASGSLQSTGTLQIQPSGLTTTIGLGGATGSFALPASYFSTNFVAGFSGITVGRNTHSGKITVGATTVSDSLTLQNTTGGIELTGALSAVSGKTVILDSTGTVTDMGSGSISATNLALTNASSVTLDASNNSVGTIAASVTGSLTFVNNAALTVGTVNPAGITATGAIRITATGNLTVNENISTTDTTNSAVVLVAGSGQAAGTATGGDITIGAGKTITVGNNGRATLYTGSIAGDGSLLSLAGSGSGRFRYNSNEGTTNFTTALGSGLQVIHRERPTADITGMTVAMTYGDALPVATTTGTVNGDASSYSIANAVYSGANQLMAGSYTINSSLSDLGYNVTGVNVGFLTVNSKALTMSGLTVPASKVYDGTTQASLGGAAALQAAQAVGSGTSSDGMRYTGDVVSIAGIATGTYNSKDVVNASTVTFGGLSLTGADAVNYTLTIQTPTAATITPKALSVSGSTASDKVYDATTSASITVGTLSGFIGSETVTATASGTFNSANAGSRTASATYTLVNGSNGGLASNYALADSSGLAATITRAPLTVRANDDANLFGRSVTGTAAFNGVSYSGFVNGETSAVVTGTALVVRTGAQADAGTYFGVLVPDTSTLNATNYSFTPASGNYTIVPANQLLVRVQNSGITYGTTPSYTITSAQYLTSDNTTVRSVIPSGSGTTFMADGATFSVAPTGSNNTSNAGFSRVGSYQLGGNVTSGSSVNFNNNLVVVGSLEVSSIGLTASASGVTKVYDGTTSMTGVTLGLSTLKAGDVVTVNGQGAFSSRSVGTNLSYSISALSLSGADAGNYHLTGGSSFSGSNGQITPASAYVTGSTTNLTYNGLTQHQIAPTSSGFLAGDSITISGAASGKDAGTYQSSLTVSGTDVGNYSVTVTNANLLIGKASLTLSGTRTYDGGTTFAGQYLTATGVNGETFTVTGSGSSSNLASKNVSANPLGTTLSSVDGLSLGSSSNGGQSANYNVLGTTGSSIGLTKANLSITATPSLAGNIYNGSPFYGTYTSTALSADTASLIVSGLASGTHAGTYTSNLMVAGSALANYNTPIITNADLVISPKAVTVTNTSRSSIYDGSSTYGSLAGGMTFTTSALIGQDSVASVTQTATGVTTGAVAQAGNFSVIPSLAVMGTGLASNYSFSYAASTHSVNKASLQVSANNASKTYDAAAYSGGNGVSYTGLVGGERASVLGGTLSYGGSSQGATNVGSYTITPSGLSSNNYAITYANGTLTISPAALTAIVGTLTGSVNKVYDGTNTATLDSTNFKLSGWMGSDGASVTKTTGTYDSKSVGTGKTVTVNLASSDYAPAGSTVLANYSLPTTITGAVGSVTPAALSISGITAVDKVYDGTTAAMINTTGAVKDGLITGDIVNIVASGAFADKNVGNAKVVSISDMALNGLDAVNYRLVSSSASASANISKADLQVIGAAASNKSFDGSRSATVIGGRITPFGSDAVSLSAANATFNDESIGINKPVSTFYTLTGTDAGNYTVVQPNGLTASINPNPASTPTVQQIVVIPAVTVSVIPSSVPLVAVNSAQGNTSFVAVKTFDVVKFAPGTSFTLSLPDNTFTHSISSTPLQISATTASGNPLPDWLQFSPGERRFTGTAPVGVTSLQVLVVATDTNGNQASTTLTLQFGDPSR